MSLSQNYTIHLIRICILTLLLLVRMMSIVMKNYTIHLIRTNFNPFTPREDDEYSDEILHNSLN